MSVLLFYMSSVVYLAYGLSWVTLVLGSSALGAEHRLVELARAVGSEMRPFTLPAIVAEYLARVFMIHQISVVDVITLAAQMFVWWSSRNDWDDRWKRRIKRAAEKVQASGHRLVVVPAGGES